MAITKLMHVKESKGSNPSAHLKNAIESSTSLMAKRRKEDFWRVEIVEQRRKQHTGL